MGILDIFSKINDKKTDDKNLVLSINQLFETSQTDYTRVMMELVWYRNVLYYLGEQYIEYVKSLRSFRRRIMPDYIPTPVSNEIREYVRTIKSLLLQGKKKAK